ncbi:hypothetical protein CYMTET_49220 [Cymbomonas tetramitiformis]|uniref:Glycosyl transferase CAP10 domain-containing protein n=1 Tax=Cymbomonas tetramitiformis TaxID=36881 RepID=A0AAE0BRR7_9CHLO|nr:hypothetical protein CYMTET_49220 [Cymbomonas tetramitiformis]
MAAPRAKLALLIIILQGNICSVQSDLELYLPSLISTTGVSKVRARTQESQPNRNDSSAKPDTRFKQPATGSLLPDPALTPRVSTAEAQEVLTLQPEKGPLQWKHIVEEYLEPWNEQRGGRPITKKLLDDATQALRRIEFPEGSEDMPRLRYSPDVWRAQIRSGQLWILEVHLLEPWARYSASMKLVLLETLRRHPDLPDVDIIVNQWDEPLVSANVHAYRNATPPPLFSTTRSPDTHDVPFPDFSFFYPLTPHRLRTERWDLARPKVLRAGDSIAWEDKIDRAAFSGNVQAEFRKRAAHTARVHPEDVFMNSAVVFDVNLSCFEHAWLQQQLPHRRANQPAEAVTREEPTWHAQQVAAGKWMRGDQRDVCWMDFHELCRFKYLVSISGNTYSNRLKYLFLCNSVVINIRKKGSFREFFEPLLTPGQHFIQLDDVRELPRVVAELRANDHLAEAMARRGTAIMSRMDTSAVCDYVAEALTQYAKHSTFTAQPIPYAQQIVCEDDLWARYGFDGTLDRDQNYLTHDTSRCLATGAGSRQSTSRSGRSTASGRMRVPRRGRWEWDARYHKEMKRFIPPGSTIEELLPTPGLQELHHKNEQP